MFYVTNSQTFPIFYVKNNVHMFSYIGTMWIYSMPVAATSWLRSMARGSHWTRILGLRYSGGTRQLSKMWTQ